MATRILKKVADFGSNQKYYYIFASHSCDSLCPLHGGYGLYNNNFLISLSVMDSDIFLLFYNVFKKNSIYLHRFRSLVYIFLLIIIL